MKTYTFPYNILSGKFDCVSTSIDVDLSDENAERLERSAREESRVFLSEDEKLADIYDQVLSAIIEEQIDYYRSDPMDVIDYLAEEYDYDEDDEDDEWDDDQESDEPDYSSDVTDDQIEEYLECFDFPIFYPKELQSLREDE